MTPHVRNLLFAAAFAVLAPLSAAAQQKPDPNFDPRVADPMFKDRHPLVMFDAAHNNLYTANDRYIGLSLLARNDGCGVEQRVLPITPAALGRAKVFVISDPVGSKDPMSESAESPAFTHAEVDALIQWIKAGGGLLFAAEHAPTGYAALGLASQLGVDFSAGFLSDPALQDSMIGGSTLVFSRDGGSIGDHPVTLGRKPTERVNRVKTFTGQSIKGPPGSAPLLVLSPIARDNMIRVGRPPGPIPDSLVRSAAGRTQGVAFTLGKGRVVVLGEGAMLSAGIMEVSETFTYRVGLGAEDNRQFALNVLRWLAGGLK